MGQCPDRRAGQLHVAKGAGAIHHRYRLQAQRNRRDARRASDARTRAAQ
jgi:hypothetical protein